jgi:hypothetical protein
MMDKKSKRRKLSENREEALACMLLSQEVLKKDVDSEEDEVWNNA